MTEADFAKLRADHAVVRMYLLELTVLLSRKGLISPSEIAEIRDRNVGMLADRFEGSGATEAQVAGQRLRDAWDSFLKLLKLP